MPAAPDAAVCPVGDSLDVDAIRTKSPESCAAPADFSRSSAGCPGAHISVRPPALPTLLRAAPLLYILPQDSNKAAPDCASCEPLHRTIFLLRPIFLRSGRAPHPGT